MENQQALLLAFKNGSHKAMAAVFNANYDFAYLLCFKIVKDEPVAEDIVLDCFVKLFDNHAEVDNIRGFLSVIVKNAALNYIKSIKRKEKRLKEYAATIDQIEMIPEIESNSDLLDRIYKCFPLMPPNYSKAFQLIHFEGKKPAEIGRLLNKKPHTIQVHYCRAIDWIKKHLKV